jgi:hypothetical protein
MVKTYIHDNKNYVMNTNFESQILKKLSKGENQHNLVFWECLECVFFKDAHPKNKNKNALAQLIVNTNEYIVL